MRYCDICLITNITLYFAIASSTARLHKHDIKINISNSQKQYQSYCFVANMAEKLKRLLR